MPIRILFKTNSPGEAKSILSSAICLRIGYMLYAKFMSNKKFAENVMSSSLDPNKRTYRNTKIKITHDEYELTFLRNDD